MFKIMSIFFKAMDRGFGSADCTSGCSWANKKIYAVAFMPEKH